MAQFFGDREKKSLFLLYAISFCLRLIIFAVLAFTLGQNIFMLGDSVFYQDTARHILAGNGFAVTRPEGPTLQDFRPPGYPLLIAGSLALTKDVWLLLVLQIFLASAIPVLTYLLAKEILSDRRSMMLAAYVAVFEPLFVFFSFYLVTDILFLLFSLGATILALRFFREPTLGRAAGIGFLLGGAVLLRAVGEYMILIIGAFIFWKIINTDSDLRYRFMKYSAVGFLLFLVMVSPWILRNIYVFDNPSVSSEGPWVLYFDLIPSLYSIDRGLSFPEARSLVKKHLVDKYGQDIISRRISPPLLLKESLLLLKAEKIPLLIKLQAINTLWFFTHDNYAYHLDRIGILPDRPPLFSPTFLVATKGVRAFPEIFSYLKSVYFVPILGRVFWVLVSVGALVGMILLAVRRPESRPMVLFLLGMVLYHYLAGSLISLAGEARIRMPVFPIFFIFASMTFFVIFDWFSKRVGRISGPQRAFFGDSRR